jgi:mono/diheme cytochrome c family protein
MRSGRLFSMLSSGWLGAIFIFAGSMQAAGPAQQQQPPPAAVPATSQATFQRYCVSCHNQNVKDRGMVPIAFEKLNLSNVSADAEVWEQVVRKVRTGVMPPPGRPRPDAATHEAFVGGIESELDRLAAARPNPGRTEPFHRLNRAEYKNVVRDLFDLDVNVGALLPSDDASYGFDNIAGVLKMSPTLMDRYLAAAQKISRLAVGTPPPVPNVDFVRLADDLQQDAHIEGLPVGTRGGTSIRYAFPMDAEYVIKVRLARDILENVPVFAEDQHLEVSLDGERIQLFTVPGFRPQPAAPRPAAPPVVSTTPTASPTTNSEQSGPPAQAAANRPQRGGGPPAAAAPQGRGARPRPSISQVDTGPRLSAKERQERNHIDDTWDVRVRVKAGQRQLNVTFIKLTAAIDETPRLPLIRPYAANVNTPDNRMGVALRSVEIVGPYNPTGAADSPSRRRIFVCQPAAPKPGERGSRAAADESGPASATASARSRRSSPEISASEGGCAKTILSTLARRAYRRPVTDADVRPLLAMYADGRAEGSFDTGIERAVTRLLVSPEFLFRIERDPANVAPNTPYRISDLELASRLSFFLWSSIPDDELLTAATGGRLKQPAVLAQQVKRMTADPRAEAFVKNFAGQWLYLRNLPSAMPISFNFPDFDDALRASMQRETELFFDSIIREDHGALDLLTANYTFLNERLARHYGIPNVKGTHFRRVTLEPDSIRAGLLGHGSVLTVTSHPDRTSPVNRGKWILENLLGTSPPPPPPNVPELKPSGDAGKVLSMRDRMVQHRADPVCAGCHAIMDPIGLSLENLDAVGRARTLGESSEPIDASGSLPDGTKFVGAAGLKKALLTKSEQVVTTITEKLLTYSLGRGLEYYDAPAVRAIVREARAQDYRFTSGLIMGVVTSAPFQMRMTQPSTQSAQRAVLEK